MGNEQNWPLALYLHLSNVNLVSFFKCSSSNINGKQNATAIANTLQYVSDVQDDDDFDDDSGLTLVS